MIRFRKTLYLVVECGLLVILSATTGVLILRENVFRQLPLYCFLEEKAQDQDAGQDSETYEKLMESNARYLSEMVIDENKEAENQKIENKETENDETGDRHSEKKKEQNIEKEEAQTEVASVTQVKPMPEIDLTPKTLANYDYLMNHFFIVDSNTETNAGQLNAATLLGEDLTLPKEKTEPQILIYHSHSQEAFSDSREGKVEDTIVGVGEYLTQLLTEKYGYQVMHVTETFDMAGGELDRSKAYDYAREWLEPVLEKHSSIQVLIDLHRDGVPEDRHLVTQINGRPTAQIMFYNGLSHTVSSGDLSYLPNPYIQDNLAFSFQLEYQAALYYPELYRGIYLAGFRYNLHLRPRALLLEAGAQTNTVQEVKNAMEPFADILDRVLQGEK